MSSSPSPADPEANPWVTHETRKSYDNPWISVLESDVTDPSGKPGLYGVVHYKNVATGVVPIDDDGNTWLVGQFRYPSKTYEWEIPEGGSPEGEIPLETAKRELLEETGLRAQQWEPLLENVQLSNSVSDEVGFVWVARGLSQTEAQPESTEQLQLRKLPLTEAIDMAMDGKIRDMLTVASLLKLRLIGA